MRCSGYCELVLHGVISRQTMGIRRMSIAVSVDGEAEVVLEQLLEVVVGEPDCEGWRRAICWQAVGMMLTKL